MKTRTTKRRHIFAWPEHPMYNQRTATKSQYTVRKLPYVRIVRRVHGECWFLCVFGCCCCCWRFCFHFLLARLRLLTERIREQSILAAECTWHGFTICMIPYTTEGNRACAHIYIHVYVDMSFLIALCDAVWTWSYCVCVCVCIGLIVRFDCCRRRHRRLCCCCCRRLGGFCPLDFVHAYHRWWLDAVRQKMLA